MNQTAEKLTRQWMLGGWIKVQPSDPPDGIDPMDKLSIGFVLAKR